jgi:hypothetical protein
LLIQANKTQLQSLNQVGEVSGLCVGDAHAENFGFLIQKDGQTLFAMNDMDDSGPCPVIADVIRLMVSSSLYDNKIDLNQLWKSYRHGLEGKNNDMPKVLSDMAKKSVKDGTMPSGSKVSENKIVRDNLMTELTPDQINEIHSAIAMSLKNALPNNAQIIDAVQTSKVGGGSGGLTRIEVLYSVSGELLQLELKEEVTPSIYPIATSYIPELPTRIQQTIAAEMGPLANSLYSTTRLFGKSMLIRPRFHGNIGVTLNKESLQDNESIIYFEAYTLGMIHARTISAQGMEQLKLLNVDQLILDSKILFEKFDSKYQELTKKP